MITPLRVLMIEDSEDDAFLLLRALKKGGFSPDHLRVDTAEAVQTALEAQNWDVILCDYNLRGFDGLSALELYHQAGLDIPFILVSGTIGEEIAVLAMRSGAHDYLMKENLTRLVPVIQRELHEADMRRARRQAEHALRASERRYRLLFEHAPSGISEIDLTNLKFISVNEVMCEYTGYTREEFLALSPLDLLTEQGGKQFLERMSRMLSNIGVPETAEYKIKTKSGGEFWVILRFRLTQESDRLVATIVAHDISERKRAEQALRLYSERVMILREVDRAILQAESQETIAQAALQHIHKLAPHIRSSVLEFNYEAGIFQIIAATSQKATKLGAGVKLPINQIASLVELLRHGRAHFVNDIDDPPIANAMDELLKAEGVQAYLSIPLMFQNHLIGALNIGADQKHVYTEEHVELVRDIANQLAVALRQAQLHGRVRQHAHELEQRVAERTQELQVANQHLEALTRVKDEFVSNVSHELRSPIANLKLQQDLLAQHPEKARHYLKTIRREIERLELMVEDLLSLSRLDQERYAWNPALIDLNDLCKDFVVDRILLAANRDIRLLFTPQKELPKVHADRGLLGQVLSILLTNAI
jgi:PAS domain S-box-containing protein